MLDKDQILKLRLALGENQTQFAARLGVTAYAVRLWELGERHPRWAMMETLNNLWAKTMKRKTSASA